MPYEWDDDVGPFVPPPKLEELHRLVEQKIKKGRTLKWSLVGLDIAFLGAVLFFVGWLNMLNLKAEALSALLPGIIAFQMAVVAFLSPLRSPGSVLTVEEVDRVLGKMVTGDVFKKISRTVEEKAAGTSRWLAILAAIGLFAATIMSITT